jgi:tRNA A-37 threonylcarbamoyl transferase component Bud32
MREIEELVKNKEKYKDALIQKRFDSKKNTVVYVTIDNKPRILKWYVPGLKRNMETEYSVLTKGFPKISIPSPLEKDEENNVIIMSYITGKNLCDVINDPSTSINQKKKTVCMLAEWFAAFHEHFKTDNGFHIRGDSSLRNFILKDGIWGVDFEESRIGKPVEDVAGLCASILSTDPMFTTEKFQLCKTFLDAYRKSAKWPLEKINDEISYALLERIQWRPEDEDYLRKYAKNIRKNGLR